MNDVEEYPIPTLFPLVALVRNPMSANSRLVASTASADLLAPIASWITLLRGASPVGLQAFSYSKLPLISVSVNPLPSIAPRQESV